MCLSFLSSLDREHRVLGLGVYGLPCRGSPGGFGKDLILRLEEVVRRSWQAGDSLGMALILLVLKKRNMQIAFKTIPRSVSSLHAY